MGLIYCTTNLIDGKKYIGKQWQDNKHYYLGSGLYLQRAVQKYGKKNFKKEILESNIYDYDLLSEREKYYIKLYDALNSDEYYNLTEGGDGVVVGRKFSEETKRKMSESAKGRKHETLLKAVYQYDLNGFFIAEYEGVAIACRELGWNFNKTTDICRACNKTRGTKSVMGYVWEYKENVKDFIYYI